MPRKKLHQSLRKAVGRVVRHMRPGTRAGGADSDSRLADFPLALVLGAQRSGTTWLQMLCGAHPRIAAGEESHLFSAYLGNLAHLFYTHHRQNSGSSRPQGLPCYVTEAEFNDLARAFARGVLGKLKSAKPGSEIVVEKTPDHVQHIGFIRQLFPKAKIVHIVRDGRDVVVSQMEAAKKKWGQSWAAKDAGEAAQRWYEWVAKARAWSEPAELYHELQYEKLLADGPETLSRVYAFLGVPLPLEQVKTIYEQFSIDACRSDTAPQVLISCGEFRRRISKPPPEGFFRKGIAGDWRQSLSEADLAEVERIAGPMLAELGHTLVTPAPVPAATPAP